MRDLVHQNKNDDHPGGPAFGNLPIRALSHGIGGRFVQTKLKVASLGDFTASGEVSLAPFGDSLSGKATAAIDAENEESILSFDNNLINANAGKWGFQTRLKLTTVGNGEKLFAGVGIAAMHALHGTFVDQTYPTSGDDEDNIPGDAVIKTGQDCIGFFIDSVVTGAPGDPVSAAPVIKLVHAKGTVTVLKTLPGSLAADTYVSLALSYKNGTCRFFVDGREEGSIKDSAAQYPAGNLRPMVVCKAQPPIANANDSVDDFASTLNLVLLAAGQLDD